MRKLEGRVVQARGGGHDAAPGALTFRADLWLYPGPGGWHFVTLPADASARLRHENGSSVAAWGSLKVTARIGATSWGTSLFPDAKSGAYHLPIKADVRKREGLRAGDEVEVVLRMGALPAET